MRIDEIIAGTIAQMMPCEKVLLYAFVSSCKPERVLEIGAGNGGSAQIIVAALDANCAGKLVSIDPGILPMLVDWKSISHRADLIVGYSPAMLGDARMIAGGDFDLVFIDGDHGYGGVIEDVRGLMPCISRGAYLLFHDAWYSGVKRALDEIAGTRTDLIDCGMISAWKNETVAGETWGGMRLFRRA